MTKAPAAKDLTYNGLAQELVTAGEATGGTMEYAIGTDAATAPTEGWGTIIPTVKDAGTYYVWYKVKGDANHEDSELECLAVTILKKSMSVTADAKSKKYGEADPELTYTSEGLIEGDTLQGALTRQAGETVGTYEIRQGTLTAGDNYTMTYNPAVLTIVQSDPDVKLAPVANSLTYNGQARELVTPGEPLGGTMEYALGTDDKTAPTEGWGTAVPTGTNAGAYYVWYRVTGDASHKDVPPKPIMVTILPKALSVTADAKSKKIGEADPELTYTSEGLVEGDAFQGALTRQAGETAGTYEIQQGTLTAGDNYIMAYTPAMLTITREPGQITTSEIIIGDNLPNMTVSGFDDAVAKKLCTPEEIKRVEEGENIHITLKITGLDSPSAEDKALCEDAAASIGQNTKIGMYIDISIYKKVGNDEAQKVTDTNGNMITVTFDIPAELKAPANTQRAFYIIRAHDGKAECISATDQGDRVSFQTDKFSTYALAYQDTTSPSPVNPAKPGNSGTGNKTNTAAKTGVEGNDNTRVALIIAGVALAIGAVAFAFRRRKDNQ